MSRNGGSRNRGYRSLRRFSLVVWLLILGFLVYPAQNVTAQSGDSLFLPYVHTPASAQNTPISDVVVSQDISVASQKEALNFWTHEALAAAKPMVMPVQSGPATVDEAALALSDAVGAPGFSSAGAAAPDAASIAQAAYPEDWAALASEADSPAAVDGTSGVYDHYVVNQNSALWKIYPHIWIGRLSFQTPGGTSYCTGTSISNNVMLTAAHCIYDTTNNRFYSNWVLTPAYRNGTAPYGSFPATTCWVLTSWVNLSGSFSINSWTRYDVGVCKMGTNSAGTTLNNAVGWMGRQWNYGYVRHYNIFGYPFNDYNDATIANAGKYLHVCSAESFQQTTDTIGAGCSVSRGMSGGPWLVGYAPTLVAGAANGVSSGFFIGTPNLYSARFTSNNIVPLCTAAGC